MQKIGAFKYRGALNAVLNCMEKYKSDTEKKTFVTHSSGNHAQAVALAAQSMGTQAIVVMPENSPKVKQRAVASYGARVVLCGPTLHAREETARAFVTKESGHFIHPSNDPDVMSGQGTVGLELIDQIENELHEELDAVLIPVGGGGLASGVAMAVKSLRPNVKVFAVEPEGAADCYNSFTRKELVGHESPPSTVADGLKTTLGNNNWPVIRDFVDGVLLVSDEEIIKAMRLIWERMKMVVEPSGAVATAAVLAGKLPSQENQNIKKVGIVLSGGNVDIDNLPW